MSDYLKDFKRMALGRRLPGLNEGVEHDEFSQALVNGVRAARGQVDEERRAPKGEWALVQKGGTFGEKDRVLSAHKTKEAAEDAMRKKGGEPDSQFTKGMIVVNVGPSGSYEIIPALAGGFTTRMKSGANRKTEAVAESRLVEDDAEIAKTIAMQMAGGVGKLRLFLGAKPVAMPDGLKFSWPNKKRSLGNVCVVTLRPDDTYDMEFFNGTKSVKKFEGLYAEDLKRTFESHTGWYLSL